MSLTLFLAIYYLEAGVFFTVIPWTKSWALNPVLQSNPMIAAWADNPFIRGFVSGVGVVHLLIGVRDIVGLWRERRSRAK